MLSPLAPAWVCGRRCGSQAGDVVEQRRRGWRLAGVRRMHPARPAATGRPPAPRPPRVPAQHSGQVTVSVGTPPAAS